MTLDVSVLSNQIEPQCATIEKNCLSPERGAHVADTMKTHLEAQFMHCSPAQVRAAHLNRSVETAVKYKTPG